MEIIRHGTFTIPNQKFFECIVCNCIFRIDANEADDIHDYDKGYAVCPECGMLSFEISKEKVKDSIINQITKVDD